MVTDNGKSMVSALTQRGNLVVKCFLKSSTHLEDNIKMDRKLCKLFSHLNTTKLTLLELMWKNDIPQHSLIYDISTLRLLDQLYEQRKAINHFLMIQADRGKDAGKSSRSGDWHLHVMACQSPVEDELEEEEDIGEQQMCHTVAGNNLTAVTEFILLGFQISQDFRILLFGLLLVVYWGTIFGNLLIITLVSTNKILHTPMYFFISQLSISDIVLITDIVPNLLHVLLNNGGTITFIGCIAQYCIFSFVECIECFLLTVMSYDRYVAICNPLRYSTIMTSGQCVIFVIVSWILAFYITLLDIITGAEMIFCGPNTIDHFFCDIVPLLELACSGTFFVQLEIYTIGIPLVFIPTTIIVASYTYIVRAVLRIPSSTGRQKAFSTCSSHLIVVSIYFSSVFSVYIVPTKGKTVTISKILSLLYTVFTPLVNPIIYSLRNRDIKKAIQERLHMCVIW
ncbi:olfactory receptor 1J2-like [Leptodactylus fuscus]|uniref:olfactory receptor 1J2-like n=1 Tax=Leptodactylus fuscus TaxID=238119 RepID=UPI003F4E7CBE